MILLKLLKKNFSLIVLGFNYFRVKEYMLDISSLSITNRFMIFISDDDKCKAVGSTVVKNCSCVKLGYSYENY